MRAGGPPSFNPQPKAQGLAFGRTTFACGSELNKSATRFAFARTLFNCGLDVLYSF
jgi:hypothetical protein